MSITLTIYDATLMGEKTPRLRLDFAKPSITIRDLIRDRIYYEEVQNYNQEQPNCFIGLVQSNNSEQVLNGYQLLSKRHSIDLEERYEKALQVFEHSGLMILVNDCPVESLDAEITLTDMPIISFLQTYLKVTGEIEVSSVKQNVRKSDALNNFTFSLSHMFTTMSQYSLWAR